MFAGYKVFTTKHTLDKIFENQEPEDFIKEATQLFRRERQDLANIKFTISGRERVADARGRTVECFPEEFISAVQGILFSTHKKIWIAFFKKRICNIFYRSFQNLAVPKKWRRVWRRRNLRCAVLQVRRSVQMCDFKTIQEEAQPLLHNAKVDGRKRAVSITTKTS